jgi:hypothetical protein
VPGTSQQTDFPSFIHAQNEKQPAISAIDAPMKAKRVMVENS